MSKKKPRTLVLNSFVNECIKCSEAENDRVNGHIYCDTPIGALFIYTHLVKSLPESDTYIIDGEALMYDNAWKGMDHCWELLNAKISEIEPEVIGISQSYYHGSRLFHETCRRIKEFLPDCTIVGGGNYPTDATDIVLEDPHIDYVIKSEGEATFLEFLAAHYAGKDVSHIDGICYRNPDGEFVINDKTTYIPDISVLPIPDRSVLPMEMYGWGRNVMDRIYPGARFLTMITSRGCPYQCTFCSNKHFWGLRVKYRSVSQVVDEIEILSNEFGAEVIGFNDDNFFVHRKRCLEIMDELNRRKLKVKWFAQGGTLVKSLADEEFLETAVESGLVFLNLAIESGSEETLQRIKKPLDLETANKLVSHVKKTYPDLYMNSGFIVGFPFETRADIINTLEYSASLDLDWAVYNNFRPFPGTELYDFCVENGIIEKFTFHSYDETTRAYADQSLVNGEDWDSEWLTKTIYEYNLRVNFLNNTNIRKGNYKQALNDFYYVMRSFKGHAIGHRQASIACEELGFYDKAGYHRNRESEIMSEDNSFTRYYEMFSLEPINDGAQSGLQPPPMEASVGVG